MSCGMKLRSYLLILALCCCIFGCEAALTQSDAQNSFPAEGISDSSLAKEHNDSKPSSELEDISTQETDCTGPNPQGCAELQCEPGFICDLDAECVPSYCSCDKEKGLWLCTTDCLGGLCVPLNADNADTATSVEPEPDPPSSACLEPNPAGCVQTGCPAGRKCDLNVGCAPSSCECDADSGAWSCTEDCGGGLCVPKEALECMEPDPTGCVNTGCEEGFSCDTTKGCAPSECWCDGVTGKWGCTADCSGGLCVPEDAKECTAPNPVGCLSIGCPKNMICDPELGCAPSACDCDPATGSWVCTDDCNGGTCKNEEALGKPCPEPNPAGCKTTGCKPGEVCDLTVGCTPSSCFCESNTGIWNCTEDCGGGSCIKTEAKECEPGTVSVKLNCIPCNEALDLAEADFAIAQAKYGICDSDEDCIAKSFPSACGPGCPVAIHAQWAPLYESFLENNAPTYCADFEENCPLAPPVCLSGEAFCSEGQCSLKEGE